MVPDGSVPVHLGRFRKKPALPFAQKLAWQELLLLA